MINTLAPGRVKGFGEMLLRAQHEGETHGKTPLDFLKLNAKGSHSSVEQDPVQGYSAYQLPIDNNSSPGIV